MSDIQATFTAQTTQATQAIDQVGAAFDRMEAKVKKANKATKDLQAEFSKGLKQSGEAVGKAGGPLGSVGGRILGGVSMGGGLGILAGGLAAVTTAYSAISASSQKTIEDARSLADSIDKLGAAAEKGQKGVEAQAAAGAAQAPTIRKLFAMGGNGAMNMLKGLEGEGIDTDSAAGGLQAVMRRFAGQDLSRGAPANAIAQATNLSKLGMDFKDAIESLIQQGGLGDENSARRSAALVFRNQSGQRGDPAELYRNALSRVADDEFLTNEEKARKISGRLPGSQRGRSGALVGMAQDNLALALDPLSKAMLENNKLVEKQLELQKMDAENQHILVRALEHSVKVYGEMVGLNLPGSNRDIADEAVIRNSSAIFRPDR